MRKEFKVFWLTVVASVSVIAFIHYQQEKERAFMRRNLKSEWQRMERKSGVQMVEKERTKQE